MKPSVARLFEIARLFRDRIRRKRCAIDGLPLDRDPERGFVCPRGHRWDADQPRGELWNQGDFRGEL